MRVTLLTGLLLALLASLNNVAFTLPVGDTSLMFKDDTSARPHSAPMAKPIHQSIHPRSIDDPNDPFSGVDFGPLHQCEQYTGMKTPHSAGVKVQATQATRNDPNRRIFEDEYTDGNGVTLHIRVIMQHGGHIEIYTAIPRGTFKFDKMTLLASGEGKVLPTWEGWYITTNKNSVCTYDTGLAFGDVNGWDLGYTW